MIGTWPTSSTEPRDPLLGTTLEGGVQLVAPLGRTGIGAIYRAEAYLDRREVAVLLLTENARVEPLRNQFRHATRIRHPNVAAVEALGEVPGGQPFVVLELLAGDLLSTELANGRAPTGRAAVDLVVQAAAGLEAAHAVDMMHGNLSPATLLITRPGGKQPLVKIVGFALDTASETLAARRYSGTGVESDGPVGSGQGADAGPYAAPERLAGQPASRSSDIYSLGAVLFHLLTGAPPGGAGSAPRHLEAVIRRALAAAPADRFRSAADFARALELAAGEPARVRRAKVRRGLTVAVPATLLVVAAFLIPWSAIGTSATGAMRALTRRAAVPAELGMERNAPTTSADSAPLHSVPAARARPVRRTRPRPRPPPAVARTAPARGASSANISPFRRRFPWAGVVDGQTYFSSGCDAALRAAELVYFRSEAEARAGGRTRSQQPGCS